jgi:conjugative transfer region protein TrbK
MTFEIPKTLRLIAIGLGGIAVLAAAVELTRTILTDDTGHVVTEEALRVTLARCRDLTREDYASDTDCRAAWEEARQRFFDLAPDQSDAPAGAE